MRVLRILALIVFARREALTRLTYVLALIVFAGCKAYDINYADDDNEDGVIDCDTLLSFEPTCVNKTTNIKLVLINSGTFKMGANDAGASENEGPVRDVTIAKPFYIAFYETSKTEWRAVMGGDRGAEPIGGVSWASVADSKGFIAKLNADAGVIIIGGAQYEYALPSEAQWEYAARGETNTRFSWGDETIAGGYAWYDSNSGARTHPVGAKNPNGFGLYDTSGNVAEWVQDCYVEYPQALLPDPINECYNGDRVVRGGDYGGKLTDLRVSRRDYRPKLYSDPKIGFRLALVAKR